MDEILVKGQDGKWYILKGEELLPFEEVSKVTKEPKVAEVTEPLQHLKPPAPSHIEHPLRVELEELVDQVMKNVELRMQNAEWLQGVVLKKRFKTIVSARLRDVRDAAETREVLTRPVKIGGMGITDAEVQRAMGAMETAFSAFQAKWKAIEEKKITEWKNKQQQQTLPPQISKPTAPVVPHVSPKPISPPPPAPIVPKAFTAPVVPPRSGKITDIRPAPKLLGPVEELASLTLEDFRRLGAVEEAVKKILSRVEVLSSQGLTRRLEGIKAWQNSPLHRLYIDLTAAAFAARQSVDAVITDRQSRNEPTLTSPEFHGIMELNHMLRNL